MKLLYCTKCNMAFSLKVDEWRRCECGETRGRYVDQMNAEYYGEHAIPFAVDNASMSARIHGPEKMPQHNEMYDKWWGPGKIQAWLLREGNPNFETIKKVAKPKEREPKDLKQLKRLGRC